MANSRVKQKGRRQEGRLHESVGGAGQGPGACVRVRIRAGCLLRRDAPCTVGSSCGLLGLRARGQEQDPYGSHPYGHLWT